MYHYFPMPALIRLRKIGLMERFHVTRNFLGLDSCVVSSAQYTTQDSAPLTKEILFPALRTLIETHAPLGLQVEGDEATANVYWVRLPNVDLSRIVELSGKEDLKETFEARLARPVETQTDLPLWRIEVLADNRVVFAVHHALADGMSTLAFHLHLFRALQQGSSGNTAPSVAVPTTNVFHPPLEGIISVRPSLPFIFAELYNLVAPLAWRKARSAWTGNPTPTTPDLTTRVRMLTLSAPDVAALSDMWRTHGATLTSVVYMLTVTVLARMLAADPAHYKRVAAIVAVSMHGVAGLADDEICDFPSVQDTMPFLTPVFSWPAAARVAHDLRAQKRKGREMIGMLRFLFGRYVPYFRDQFGKKRTAGFVISNLGRVQVPAVEGKWKLGATAFAQCDVVVGAAFSINITGDPTGAVNIVFAWGERSIEPSFAEAFAKSFEEAFKEL
ncbi:alcohol acetyltransferase, partial [Mycena maculata]